MANPKYLKILKRGVKAWNKWRVDYGESVSDLSGADFSRADFSRANLSGADFSRANLSGANLRRADLSDTMLKEVNLKGADISYANFKGADISYANLSGTAISGTNLNYTKLSGVNLSGANLSDADIRDADLSGADFTHVTLSFCWFGNSDLSVVRGLETVKHSAPSHLSTDMLFKSAGKIPDIFLRGCGLNDWQIENAKLYQPELSSEEITNILYRVHDLRAGQPIQISPLFISYTHTDSPFVDMMEWYLNEKGVRFWRDIHHSTAGRLEKQIDRAIRYNPTVLLILSSESVQSDWVEHEARLARKLEQETKRDVLCPIALDDSWKTCRWPERLREQIEEYNILDFSKWEDDEYMQRMFKRLIDGLGLFYK